MATEEIGNDIQATLARQTQVLLKSRTKMDAVRLMLSQSQLYVRDMAARMSQNRLTLLLVGVAILVALGVVLLGRA